jgi:hypothetical protein
LARETLAKEASKAEASKEAALGAVEKVRERSRRRLGLDPSTQTKVWEEERGEEQSCALCCLLFVVLEKRFSWKGDGRRWNGKQTARP